MKDLIKQALAVAIIILENSIPQTKLKVVEDISLDDINPIDIAKYMKDNNIPDNAYFMGIDNGDDGYSRYCLAYDIQIPTTDKDKDKYRKERFTSYAFKQVYDLLIKNGYKRISSWSSSYKEFDKKTVYEMFTNNEFDRLVQYYSLSFFPVQ